MTVHNNGIHETRLKDESVLVVLTVHNNGMHETRLKDESVLVMLTVHNNGIHQAVIYKMLAFLELRLSIAASCLISS